MLSSFANTSEAFASIGTLQGQIMWNDSDNSSDESGADFGSIAGTVQQFRFQQLQRQLRGAMLLQAAPAVGFRWWETHNSVASKRIGGQSLQDLLGLAIGAVADTCAGMAVPVEWHLTEVSDALARVLTRLRKACILFTGWQLPPTRPVAMSCCIGQGQVMLARLSWCSLI